MPKIYNVDQRSQEWHDLHQGRITASGFKTIMDGSPKAWESMMRKLAGEEARPFYGSSATDWGEKHEPQAVAAYELETGEVVEPVGFATHDDYEFVGASPDGLVNFDGGLEIKCPFNPANHIATLQMGMPEKHVPQVQGNIWVLDRDWWDFVSFDPRQEPKKRLYRQRVFRDDVYIKRLEEKINRFWEMFQRGRAPATLPDSFDALIGG